MPENDLKTIESRLKTHAARMSQPGFHLKHLLEEDQRLERFSRFGGGLFYDFSRQRLDDAVLDGLLDWAENRKVLARFQGMTRGDIVNRTEGRAALHTATRRFNREAVMLGGADITAEMDAIRQSIRRFSADVRSGRIRSQNGSLFSDIVVVGIGGSYLGTEFVARALEWRADANRLRLHFLSNVDIDNFGSIVRRIDVQTTLWIVISKSYTTAETMANARQVAALLKSKEIDPARHTVTVTSKGSPGDDPARPCLASFHMFDFIGGRYSVSSAVGGVPLSLYLGYDVYEAFLQGAGEMDRHAEETSASGNLPLLAALISVWNSRFLGYETQAVIPYAALLSKLAAHIQQLNMESNGKSVDTAGHRLEGHAGTIIFGEPGTNAQHSFFQLAHQGRPFPIEFVGMLQPSFGDKDIAGSDPSNHQELWANMMAQADALARGGSQAEAHRSFRGNRPSATILMKSLSPGNIGRLLSFYEAKTVFEAFLLDINPFDQFGVELGKKVAAGIRDAISHKNRNSAYNFSDQDETTRRYLAFLFCGKLSP